MPALERLEWRQLLTAVRVADINTYGNPSDPREFTEFEGAVYFRAGDWRHGAELWRTDGTAAGTELVADLSRARNRPRLGGLRRPITGCFSCWRMRPASRCG